MYGYLIRCSWFLKHHWYDILMDSKSVREVKFFTVYTSGFPLHDAPFLVLKGPYSVTIHFRFVCVCVHIRLLMYSLLIKFWCFFFLNQFASHEISSELPVTLIMGLALCMEFILNTQYSHSLTDVTIMFHGALRKSNFM